MSIRHIVMWTLLTDDAEEKKTDTEQIRAALEGLIGSIPEIRHLTVRQNVLHDGSNYDLVLDSLFDDADALEAYASHPLHVAAGAIVKSLTKNRVAVDCVV